MDKNLQFIRRGKTGYLFASILAKNPEKIGWKRILNPTTLEIPEDANIVSFIFEGKDKEYVREWALMNGMYEDITSKNTIGLRIKTEEGVSWVQYFGKDSHAKTRQTPNAELLFCVKLPKKRKRFTSRNFIRKRKVALAYNVSWLCRRCGELRPNLINNN